MITKPAVTATPIIVKAAGTIIDEPREIVSLHFVNSTAGAGSCTVHDGTGNGGVVLGSDAAGGKDDWCPSQPARFQRTIVEFSGSGTVTIQFN